MPGMRFPRLPALLGLIWLTACLIPSIAAGASQERVAELMRVSGLEEQVQSAGQAFTRGIRNATGDNPQVSEQAVEKLERISRAVFSGDELAAEIRKELTEQLSEDELDQLFEWYRSETGQAITRAEIDSSQPDAQSRAMEEGAKLVEQRPELADKARQINELARGTEFLVDLNRHTAKAIMHAVRSQMDSENQRRQFTQRFEKQLDGIDKQFRQNAEQIMVRSTTYSYRNIDPAGMDAYLEFLRTPAARSFTRAAMDGLGNALKKRIDEFAEKLASNT